MQRSRLPTELCMQIVRELATEAPPDRRCALTSATLKSCALVSSEWLGITRPLLYGDVAVCDADARLRLFSRTITQCPHLGALVKALRIQIGESSMGYWTNKRTARKQFPHPAIVHLPNLEFLVFESFLNDITPGPLYDLIVAFSDARAVERLTLVSFIFNSMEELVKSIEGFTHLRCLDITGCQWISPDIPGPEGNGANFCPGLGSLEVSENLADGALLRVCPPTVHMLTLGPRGPYREDQELGDEESYEPLRRFTDLTTLAIDTHTDDETEWVVDALSYVRAPELSEVSLTFQGMGEPLPVIVERAHLSAIDEVLSSGHFPDLAELAIDFTLWGDQDYTGAEEYLQDLVPSLLPRCCEAGIEISVEVYFR